ncbi:hypothetical protein ACFU6R_33885 [Streptomyces sp. NPDC057499]|uniref:hypothetical protein n=1 Tax=Streptomyces sp. NPDC057499 TaxID=3346150 RepID=UPI0036A110EC
MSAMAYGIVNANGSKRNGQGFSSSKVDKGHYVINFSPSFSEAPAVVATIVDEGYTWNVAVQAITQENCRIEVGNVKRGDGLDDMPFSFIAVG